MLRGVISLPGFTGAQGNLDLANIVDGEQVTFANGEETPNAGAANLKIYQNAKGITLQDNQTKATLEAFADPVAAYDKYKKERIRIDAEATNMFMKQAKELSALGIPKDIATINAKRMADAWYDNKMEIFKLKYPYAGDGSGASILDLASGARRRDVLPAPDAAG